MGVVIRYSKAGVNLHDFARPGEMHVCMYTHVISTFPSVPAFAGSPISATTALRWMMSSLTTGSMGPQKETNSSPLTCSGPFVATQPSVSSEAECICYWQLCAPDHDTHMSSAQADFCTHSWGVYAWSRPGTATPEEAVTSCAGILATSSPAKHHATQWCVNAMLHNVVSMLRVTHALLQEPSRRLH